MKFLVRPPLVLLLIPVLALAGYGGLQASKRCWNRLDFVRAKQWNEILVARKKDLATHSWLDSRPLYLFAGDSHIEYVNWYDRFRGMLAVRNIGLYSARIEHVTELLASIHDRSPDTLLLHCGINNIGAGDTPASCLARYRELLDVVAKLSPARTVVVAVMPVRNSLLDSKGREWNTRVGEFNSLLADLCKSRGITLLDLKVTITGPDGGLKDEFTDDGLHLNPRGYAAISPLILDTLTSTSDL